MKARFVRLITLVAAGACACLPLTAQLSAGSVVPDRIAGTIDEAQLVTLPGNVHPLAQKRYDRGAAPASTPTGRVMLLLQRSAPQQQALAQYLSDVQNPSSASYHQWLTPAQYGSRFGLSDNDLRTVEMWLQGHGFKVERVTAGRNIIQFSGNFEQLQSAFHTSMHVFSVNGETHMANAGDPQIPAALAPVVAAVGPLHDFRPKPPLVTGPRGKYDGVSKAIKPDFTLMGTTPLLFVDPADAATIYDAPNPLLNPNYSGSQRDGTGISIGIGGASDIVLQDIENYRTGFLNESTATVNLPTVIVDGNDPGMVSGWDVEGLLDSEVSGALAPGASIYFYTAADTDLTDGFVDSVVRAVSDNAVGILSLSIQACESSLGKGGNAEIAEIFQQAAAQGITVVVAAGDDGSAGCDDFDTATAAQYGFAVNGFASTPYNVAVGGTDFDGLPAAFSSYVQGASSSFNGPPYYRTAEKYIPENPWNDSTSVNESAITSNVAATDSNGNTNIVAGSGGLSTVYTKPPFQSSLTPTDGARDVPDVSLFAANGAYQALWVLCSDPDSNGDTGQSYTECANTGGVFSDGTYFSGAGGTSAAAPAFAGMLALVEQSLGGGRMGQIAPTLYQLAHSGSVYAAAFHDITTGNNAVVCGSGTLNCGSNGFLTGYAAGTGYDLASGLGSVDVSSLIKDWGDVKLASTSTSLLIDGSSAKVTAVHGTNLTFSVAVNPGTATGSVAIVDSANTTAGGTANGPQENGQTVITLGSGGAGTLAYNGLPGGSYTVAAQYGGDSANAASTSSPITVDISPEASTTSLSIQAYSSLTGGTVSTTNIPYGSQVFADAIILGASEGTTTQGEATGSVTFTDGSATLATEPLSSESLASYPPLNSAFVILPAGTHSIVARYSGDNSYNASTSSPASFTIVKGTTVTTATATPASITSGENATVAVTVTTAYNGGAMPTGTGTLSVNGTTIVTIGGAQGITVFSGGLNAAGTEYILTASVPVFATQLGTGNNVVTVAFSGDTNYTSSTTTVTIVNTSGLGSFTLTNGGDLSEVAGGSANATVTLTPAGGFANGVGYVCVSALTCNPPVDDITVSGTAPVPTQFTISSAFGTAPGVYPVTINATDQSGKIKGSTTWNVTVTAIPSNAGISLSNSGAVSLTPGASSSTSSITIAPANGYIGVVNLTCAVSTTISNPVSTPTCWVPASETISGTTAVTAGLTLSTSSTTSPGTYTVTVTGTDAGNAGITATTSLALSVNVPEAIAVTNSGNITIAPGATTGDTATITVTPAGGFTGQVNLSCSVSDSLSNPSDVPICSIPASVTISGTTAATATLTVATTAASSGTMMPPLKKFFAAGGGAVLAFVLFFGIPARRRAWRGLFAILAVVVVLSASGCGSSGGSGTGGGGGNSNPGTTAGAYTVTVTAADAATGKITGSTAVTVTVN